MKKFIVLGALIAVLVPALVLAGCGGNKVPAGAIAAVGSGVVTQEQFDQIMAQAKAQYASADGAPDFPAEGSAQFNSLKSSIISYLVQNELIKQQAAEMKVSVSDKDLQERIKQITQQVGGQKKLDELLKKQGVTIKDVEEQLSAQMLQDALKKKVTDSVKITDEKIKAYYDDPKNKSQFVQAETVDARHVLVKTKAEADKVRALLVADNSDANWNKVAKKYSTDPGSKNSGGSLGSFSKGRMVAEFENAAFSLKINEVSEPVKTQFGWHVIEVTKKTAGSTKTLEESKETIKQQLLYTEQTTAWEKWLKEAEKKADIKYAPGFDPDVLTASPSPESSTAPSVAPSASPSASPAS